MGLTYDPDRAAGGEDRHHLAHALARSDARLACADLQLRGRDGRLRRCTNHPSFRLTVGSLSAEVRGSGERAVGAHASAPLRRTALFVLLAANRPHEWRGVLRPRMNKAEVRLPALAPGGRRCSRRGGSWR
eukprot:SAG11_NODE_1728_length_4367_cov_4.915183_5_plen_131_part_00